MKIHFQVISWVNRLDCSDSICHLMDALSTNTFRGSDPTNYGKTIAPSMYHEHNKLFVVVVVVTKPIERGPLKGELDFKHDRANASSVAPFLSTGC